MASRKQRAAALMAAVGAGDVNGAIPEGFEERSFGIPLQKTGDVLSGVYEGPGKSKKLKKKNVPTYKVNRGGAVIEVLGSAQLDQFFATVEKGDEVWIQHTGQIKAGPFGRLNTYRTAVKRAM